MNLTIRSELLRSRFRAKGGNMGIPIYRSEHPRIPREAPRRTAIERRRPCALRKDYETKPEREAKPRRERRVRLRISQRQEAESVLTRIARQLLVKPKRET